MPAVPRCCRANLQTPTGKPSAQPPALAPTDHGMVSDSQTMGWSPARTLPGSLASRAGGAHPPRPAHRRAARRLRDGTSPRAARPLQRLPARECCEPGPCARAESQARQPCALPSWRRASPTGPGGPMACEYWKQGAVEPADCCLLRASPLLHPMARIPCGPIASLEVRPAGRSSAIEHKQCAMPPLSPPTVGCRCRSRLARPSRSTASLALCQKPLPALPTAPLAHSISPPPPKLL